MFVILLNHEYDGQSTSSKQKVPNVELSKTQQQKLSCVLLKPGPDTAIFDEGHRLKSPKSHIYRIANKIETKYRIILSGTPLQNSLTEYYWIVNFVCPNLLGDMKLYRKEFIEPIMRGQEQKATKNQIEFMKRRAYVLQRLLNKCVHRRNASIYESFLKPKIEFVIHVKLSKIQIELYKVQSYLCIHFNSL